jgi:hypothetical protein
MPILSSFKWISQVNIILFPLKITTKEPEEDDGKCDSLPPARSTDTPAAISVSEPLILYTDCAQV